MSLNSKSILSVGAALAALTGTQVLATEAPASVVNGGVKATEIGSEVIGVQRQPNAHYRVGEDLLGFVLTQQADGTLVADHASHASHSSHASSRY